MWKFSGKIKKEQWLCLLLAGAALMILAMPAGKKDGGEKTLYDGGTMAQGDMDNVGVSGKPGGTDPEAEGDGGARAAGSGRVSGTVLSYEEEMEERVREILKNVEGVGKVDVMIVLKSSKEKVLHVDQKVSSSTTKEQDSGGGIREVAQSDLEESAVLSGGTSQSQPIVEKELYPELSGIVISASGGGSPQVRAEISEAMEALFGLPAHKIKVLKRVE